MFLRLPFQRVAVDLGNGDTHKRRGGVGSVVDVLAEREGAPEPFALAPDEADGVNVEQECGGTARFGRFRVEDMRLPKVEWEGLDARGVFAEQVAEVGGRGVGGGDREEHKGLDERLKRRKDSTLSFAIRNFLVLQKEIAPEDVWRTN